DLGRRQVDEPLVVQQGQDLLAISRGQRLPGPAPFPWGRGPWRRAAPLAVECGPGQPQGLAQLGDADASAPLLDQGDHEGALAPGRRSSPAKFFGASPRAPARAARPVICASCRSSSAIFRSRGSTGVGLRPRVLGVSPASSPRARARRHSTRWEEYNPSRRSRAPMAPGVVHASASLRIRRLYSAVYVRRRGFATTCTSAAPTATCVSIRSSLLALTTVIPGGGTVSLILAQRATRISAKVHTHLRGAQSVANQD